MQKFITELFLPVAQRITLSPNLQKEAAIDTTGKASFPMTNRGTLSQRSFPMTNRGTPSHRSFSMTNSGTPSQRRGFNFCIPKNCRYCPNVEKTGDITSSVTGNTYRCMTNRSCHSLNLIYCITWKKCQKQYVGQTMLRLKSWFVHHY